MARGSDRLDTLEMRDDFVWRHIGPGESQIAEMLEVVGQPSLEALIDKAVPDTIRDRSALDLPGPRTEADVVGELRALAERNTVKKSLIGQGYYGTHTPAVILRNVMENPGWYTAYTPYQPEISQGRLEALLSFQTMVMDLTGMDLANASLLDEPTAAAEAMTMAHRVFKGECDRFFVAEDCHPQTIAVVAARAEALGLEVAVGDPKGDIGEVFGILLQYPSTTGSVDDHKAAVEAAHAEGALAVVAADLLSLSVLEAPGSWGADVVVGNAQRFGVPMGFGGPHAAFFATREAHKRSTPGRIVGVSVDAEGNPALRLALQTREQHIRREKATSNICTAQVLLAVMAGLYAVYHGPERIRRTARRVHRLTAAAAEALRQAGFEIENETFFDTLTVAAPGNGEAIRAAAREAGFNLRDLGPDRVGLSLDETVTADELKAVLGAFGAGGADVRALADGAPEGLPKGHARRTPFMTHECFNRYHSETEMLRYLRRLQVKDIALDRSMIPLGSCTMKLNATTEMLPVTWPGFAALHPYVPLDQAEGYTALIEQLADWLCRMTGFDAFSMQPNAGSQGEYAGLLSIRRYHDSRGDADRDICLIPSSAHGTNPASAVMAGMRVVVVGCDDNGNVDVGDLKAKVGEHADRLAALMVTYPSTHGVFEAEIVEICDIVHAAGGQVYMDGANLNALLGVALPGKFGPDVMHVNLHKTFCIPHGGGGPGMGPIGLKAHLAPFAPGDPLAPRSGDTVPPVAAANWGSAGILPISWAYIALMGGDGLTRATEVAILNANYVAARLKPHYPVLYTGPDGLVAHECIIDLRPLKDSSGVTVDDVAKRLMDYGFHAPTMSFPVPGTLMIEPTESEGKIELDRFCDAMIAIRREIAKVEAGEWDAEDNPLRNAPHTIDAVTAGDWSHPYSREVAAWPLAALREDKYWSPVARIDQAYGDRHLVCSCPPLDAYRDAAE